MHIRMLGHTVQLCRWQVSYKMDDIDMVEYVPTEEEADEFVEQFGGVKTPLDTAGFEWVDGITADSLDSARSIAESGEQKYKFELERKEKCSPERLSANLDYLSMMTGVDIPAITTLNIPSSKSDVVKFYFFHGLWNGEMLQNAVGRWITEEEKEDILSLWQAQDNQQQAE